MYRAERSQLGHDFGFAPELVSRYIGDGVADGALKMVRQVNGVTTYLTMMATGEPRHFEGTIYAVAIAGMDVVTDELHEPVSGGVTEAALNGDPQYKELEPMALASSIARGPRFDKAMMDLAEWQDKSLDQFGNPDEQRLREITARKGGYSAVAHLHALKDDVTAEEDRLMTDFGYVMQMLDDYLDQPGDEASNISTLFTEGYMDGTSLLARINNIERRCVDVWGDTDHARRFGRVMRLHRRLGQLENRYPGVASRVLPWYF